MATATRAPALPKLSLPTPAGDQHVLMCGVGWDGYSKMLDIQGEKSRPQVVYIDGDLLLMSPSYLHGNLSDRSGTFVKEVCVGLDIPYIATGEMTFRRHDKEAGVQPDQSFYLTNHAPIAAKNGKEDIDLRFDPPPDLVIEAVHTHDADDAVEVLRRFGVPEVWVCKSEGLRILVRRPSGRYARSKKSLAFPFLAAIEIFDWVNRPGITSMTPWVKELRRWIQEMLVPRIRGQEGG